MPFTFVFNGSFVDLYHLFQQLDRFTVRTASGGLQVSGRLLTIQSVKLAPVDELRRRQGRRRTADGHDHGDRLRAARQPGADRRGDGERARGRRRRPTSSTSAAASSPTAPAIARVTP